MRRYDSLIFAISLRECLLKEIENSPVDLSQKFSI